jgi:hypothetical protein
MDKWQRLKEFIEFRLAIEEAEIKSIRAEDTKGFSAQLIQHHEVRLAIHNSQSAHYQAILNKIERLEKEE